jgi:hypothetical protein
MLDSLNLGHAKVLLQTIGFGIRVNAEDVSAVKKVQYLLPDLSRRQKKTLNTLQALEARVRLLGPGIFRDFRLVGIVGSAVFVVASFHVSRVTVAPILRFIIASINISNMVVVMRLIFFLLQTLLRRQHCHLPDDSPHLPNGNESHSSPSPTRPERRSRTSSSVRKRWASP